MRFGQVGRRERTRFGAAGAAVHDGRGPRALRLHALRARGERMGERFIPAHWPAASGRCVMSAAGEGETTGVMAVGRMALVGVGTGGCRAVAAMSEGWDDGPSMYAVDTDSRALIASGGVANHLMIGATLTRGLSAGGDMQVGRLAVEEAAESLRGIFAGMELVFLVTTLGGGTGSGAAPTVADRKSVV